MSARTVATMTTASGSSRLAALDVQELLGAEVGAEACLGDGVVAQRKASFVACTELQPWAMLANGPPCMKAGVPSSV